MRRVSGWKLLKGDIKNKRIFIFFTELNSILAKRRSRTYTSRVGDEKLDQIAKN